jgi:hypothetical protein
LFFQWSLCKNMFSNNRCSCFQVCCCRIDQLCSRFAGVSGVDQSLHRLSSRPTTLCRSLLISSPATSRYRLVSSTTNYLLTSHGAPS